MPSVYTMSTGVTHIRFNDTGDLADFGFLDRCCFVVLPPGFNEEVIPDKHIREPRWNGEPVNRWWREYRERALAAASST